MVPRRLIADEARRVEGYRTERHVSLLALALTEVAEYGELCERLDAEALADALGALGRRVHEVIETQHDGLVVRYGGGQLLAVFAEPTSAVLALRALHRDSMPLRTGIHVGQVAIERVGLHVDVFGRHMHRASCVAAVAQPGEILVTEPVADNTRSWLDAASGPTLAFAPRGRVSLPGTQDAVELFAVADAPNAETEARPLPAAYIELDRGDGRRALFDAGVDRRIVLGRGSMCDVPLETTGSSRKHAMILCRGPQWLLCDLGSTNGTLHNGRRIDDDQQLAVGDRIGIGDVVLTVTRMAHAQPAAHSTARLRVDLAGGTAHYDDAAVPLSAAELVWFAYLAGARTDGSEGWVVAGQEGHAAFRAFARPLFSHPWTVAVRTRPLLDLVDGKAIDDEDLRNLRGKTVQKLKRFGVAAIVPETDGKHRQRLPLPPAAIEITQ